MQQRNNSNIPGCDLSHYEAGIDISAAPQIVYLKCSEGQHTPDASFPALYDAAHAAGRKLGAYHFLHVGDDYSPKAQADFAASQIAGRGFDCLFGIDVEETGYHGGTPDEVTAAVLAFADRFTAQTGLPCCVYADTSFIREHFTDAITRLPAWIADYNAGQQQPGENGIYSTWAGYQYTGSAVVGGVQCDLDLFTSDIFIAGAAAPQPAPEPTQEQAAAAGPVWTADVHGVGSLPCGVNATAGTDFDVRNSDGSAVPGHEVSSGDEMIILSVDYDRQLAEILYPVPSLHGWVHGFITNLQSKIHDKYHFQWTNGSTPEPTYDEAGNRIGSIDPHEQATPLYRHQNGRLALLYNTAKGEETKFGLVDYDGSFNAF